MDYSNSASTFRSLIRTFAASYESTVFLHIVAERGMRDGFASANIVTVTTKTVTPMDR